MSKTGLGVCPLKYGLQPIPNKCALKWFFLNTVLYIKNAVVVFANLLLASKPALILFCLNAHQTCILDQRDICGKLFGEMFKCNLYFGRKTPKLVFTFLQLMNGSNDFGNCFVSHGSSMVKKLLHRILKGIWRSWVWMLRMKTQEKFLDPIVMKLKHKEHPYRQNIIFALNIYFLILYMLTVMELLIVKSSEIVPKTY